LDRHWRPRVARERSPTARAVPGRRSTRRATGLWSWYCLSWEPFGGRGIVAAAGKPWENSASWRPCRGLRSRIHSPWSMTPTRKNTPTRSPSLELRVGVTIFRARESASLPRLPAEVGPHGIERFPGGVLDTKGVQRLHRRDCLLHRIRAQYVFRQ